MTEFAHMEPDESQPDKLVWRESPLATWESETKHNMELDELCAVYYTALNFRDALNAYGKLPYHARPKGSTTI